MEELERLQRLIRDLLQVEYSDLDFGLYRLLRLKRDEVEAFITKQLPAEVDKAFAAAADSELSELKQQVEELAARLRDEVNEGIINPDGSVAAERAKGLGKKDKALVDKYTELRNKLVTSEATVADKADVFNHLYNFLSRYYEDGDFIPKRRYGDRGTYAVPWDGSEVLFHWANKDQHYVKTAETLKDYTFTLPGDLADTTTWRVRFVLVDASVSKDNVKGEDRYFFPRPAAIECDAENHECRIGFEYRPSTEQEIIKYRAASTGRKPDQEKILSGEESHLNVAALLKKVPDAELRRRLSADTRTEEQIREGKPAEPVPLLLKRMRHFVKRSTTDYFVHKNLRGFLRQELEFYIKDQVLHLGDLEGDLPARLRMLKVLRRLAEQVIDFLAQIEDAQKRLFEKKKFVTETSWLIPIQNVPESFWPDVVANKAQRQQWKDWLAVAPDELFGKKGKIDLSFLKDHPTLVVDSRLYPADWTLRLLESLPFPDLDEATDGLLVHSENYQALRLLIERFREQVKCVYIDPPYNTSTSEISYKNNYKHSSWSALLDARLDLGGSMLDAKAGVLCCTIDDVEEWNLTALIKAHFGEPAGVVSIRAKPSGRPIPTGFAISHEYAVFARRNPANPISRLPRSDEQRARYREKDTEGPFFWELLRKAGSHSSRADRPSMFFPLYLNQRTSRVRLPSMTYDESSEKYHHIEKPTTDEVAILPKKDDGTDGCWYLGYEGVAGIADELRAERRDAGLWDVYYRRRPNEGVQPSTLWFDSKYSATEHGTALLKHLFGERETFSYPKSVYAVEDCLRVSGAGDRRALVADYFAGSGTTGHAVVNLNRGDGGSRKFMLVEMGEYFDPVMLPRIVKVMFTPAWKGGKPERMATKEEAERTPRVVKVLQLESYEDALHNVASDATVQRAARREAAHKNAAGDEHYRIKYLVSLPLEASDTMLSLEKLEHPFAYTLEILTDDGPQQKQADLVETFNYLYGLRVKRYETWAHDGRGYRVVKSTDREQRRRILVVWRDMADLKPAQERGFLEGKLKELATAGETYDEKLINGDCAVPCFVSLDPLFKRLMTAGEEEAG